MYFKQIELNGFKSFADRTVVPLEEGITSVVGPNGCGKSNILDALRWCLGEQSAKALRGAHMQDVIFNGSENRQPTGMAEVALTFDNADGRLPIDFAEVQVSRRIYRSGESEYFMNKAPCRLRDIQELFMDTGIGTNAYSMIGQGKISLVLSSKPEDRRFLFEEAAGIIKYKARKRIALRKLESADQNLVRLGDIIAEVQRQSRSLKRQVAAAIRYRELLETLRELQIREAWLRQRDLQGRIVELREQFGRARDAYEAATTGTSSLQARFEELSLARIEVERTLEERRTEVHGIEEEMNQQERQVSLLRQQVTFCQDQQKRTLEESESFKTRSVTLREQSENSGEQTAAVRRELVESQDAMNSLLLENSDATGGVQKAEDALEAVRARAVEGMNRRARTQTELETLVVSIKNIDGQIEAIDTRQSTANDRNTELVAQMQDMQSRETEKQAEFTGVVASRRELAESRSQKQQEMQQVTSKWQDMREQKSRSEARLHSLRELRDSYEGFATGVRAIMLAKQKNMGNIHGIIGPVGDLLSTEKKFEQAIEAALGGNINNIIVNEADAAKNAIRFLNETKAGRVTFLPLDTIRPSHDDDTNIVHGKPGVLGPAINKVQFEGRIAPAIEYLLHNTVVVETIDDAIRIARSERRYPRMVTLDGEVVTSAGAVTGGRNKHESRGLLGRSAEIGELEEDVRRLEKEVAALGQRGQKLTEEVRDLGQQTRELEEKENQYRRQLNELGVAIARFATEIESLSRNAEQLTEERNGLIARRGELDGQRRETLERVAGMENDDEQLQREIAEAQEYAAELRRGLAGVGERLSDLRVRMAQLSQAIEESERNRERLLQESEDAMRESVRRMEQMGELKANEQQLEDEIKSVIERLTVLAGKRDEATLLVVETQNEHNIILNAAEEINRTLREVNEGARDRQSEVHRLELDLRHDEDQLTYFQELILAEYKIALASVPEDQVGADEYDHETREELIKDHREKLERMGSVNLMAIEEYDALEKRLTFLTSQDEDLRKARDTLMGVVTRIDNTITIMFRTTFDQICENFRVYFRRLFNGGQARIYLTDENDPLECGIEIEARPPGKKPQSISLLSGGEQAMTAIALLFGIFKAKPSPFCVLDEVDAPLDDANIGRFLDMVEEFTAESQFIIITHSKQTMAKANVLYGVTQQERGVSQLVSVKFDKPERPARAEQAPPQIWEESEDEADDMVGDGSEHEEPEEPVSTS